MSASLKHLAREMDFFTAFALILTLALLASAYRNEKLSDSIAYRNAVKLFIIAIAVRYPIVELLVHVRDGVPGLIWFSANLAGYIIILLSFRWLCLAWGAPLPKSNRGERTTEGL
jgi:hypothetical protein